MIPNFQKSIKNHWLKIGWGPILEIIPFHIYKSGMLFGILESVLTDFFCIQYSNGMLKLSLKVKIKKSQHKLHSPTKKMSFSFCKLKLSQSYD
jgi:hypothetical protein